ncbi:MAG: hypothetical protein ABMA64_09650 [Myxococcota bacterium]
MFGVPGALAVATGCASGARVLLFGSSPSFVVEAVEEEGGISLVGRGLTKEDLEDDLCDDDDDESCEDDLFLGIGFYRSDTGPYGRYDELGTATELEWFDPEPALAETVWRAATLRQQGDDDPRVDEVSIAASLEVDPRGDSARP